MDTLKKILLFIIRPIVAMIGKLHMPFSHKRFTGKDYYEMRDKITPGMAIFTTTRGEASNILNSSNPKHGALYVGGEVVKYVIEALGRGVSKTDLVSFLLTKDYVVVARPTFATEEEMLEIAEEAHSLIGAPYDLEFEPGDKEYYCFEVIMYLYQKKFPERKFASRDVFGVPTYVAQDILADTDNWEIIYDNRP